MKSNRSIQLALAMGALAVAPALAAAQTGSTSPPQQRESGAPGAQQGGAQQGGAQQRQGDKPGASNGQRAQQQQQGKGQKKQAMKLQEQIAFQVEEGCTYTASVNGRIEPAAAGKAQQPSGGQPGGGSQGRGGTGAQGQTGGAAQGSAGGSQAQAGGAQDRGRDTGGSQAPAGGAQGGSQAHAGAQAGAAQGGGQAGAAQGGGQAGSGAGDQERVKPNLTVSASMSCPNAPELRVTDTLKTDTAVTRSELEGMISRRASIATEKGGRFCMYVPQFELTREKLSGKGIAQLCRVPAADQKQGMR